MQILKNSFLFVVLLSIAAFAAACGGPSGPGATGGVDPNETAATVNGKAIKMEEVDRGIKQQTQGQEGKLSPLDNVTPSDLRIEELLRRVEGLQAEEVILALGSDVEGEATANYIADLLGSNGPSITRLAQGMPAGGGLDHVDELTLFQALAQQIEG